MRACHMNFICRGDSKSISMRSLNISFNAEKLRPSSLACVCVSDDVTLFNVFMIEIIKKYDDTSGDLFYSATAAFINISF